MEKKLPLLTLMGIGATVPAFMSCQKQVAERPNIIFIMSDDHAYQAISAYDGPLAELAPTPNIDRIADEGMLFEKCYVTNSICGPARATILTGKYSHLNGFKDNLVQTPFDGSQVTFPKILQQAGYQTAMIGKWHLESEPTGFDYWDILPGQGAYYNPGFINDSGQYNMSGYATEIITEKAIAWLSQAKDAGKPFMMMMHHKAPHRSWQPGPNELGMYDDVVFPAPVTLFDDYSNRSMAVKNQFMTIANAMRLEGDLKLTSNPQRGLDSLQQQAWDAVYKPKLEEFNSLNLTGAALVQYKYQRYMEDYLACIAAVDKSVGAVLDYLEENGLAENTIVIYTSDQGFYLGEHGWFDKRWMFEESLRTPLLVKWPGVIKPGTVNYDLVSNLDYAETFLDVAGTEIPSEMQGTSLVPILKGETPTDWRTAHYYHYYEAPSEHYVPRHYGITTERYKLMHFYYDIGEGIDDWEMIDLKRDPYELVDVYDNPEYSFVRDSLHAELNKLMTKYHDSDSLAMKYVQETIDNPPNMYWLNMGGFGGQGMPQNQGNRPAAPSSRAR